MNQTTWDIGLWCNLCGENIGKVVSVVSTSAPENAADNTLRHVRNEMETHERRKHGGM